MVDPQSAYWTPSRVPRWSPCPWGWSVVYAVRKNTRTGAQHCPTWNIRRRSAPLAPLVRGHQTTHTPIAQVLDDQGRFSTPHNVASQGHGTEQNRISQHSSDTLRCTRCPSTRHGIEGTFAQRTQHPNQCSSHLSPCFTPVIRSLGCPFHNCTSTTHSCMIGRRVCNGNINLSWNHCLALLGTKISAHIPLC